MSGEFIREEYAVSGVSVRVSDDDHPEEVAVENIWAAGTIRHVVPNGCA